jgi:hypothetical protein
MPRIADYVIVADNWVLEKDQDTINFEVPSNIDKGSRAILGFMLEADHIGEMKLTLRLNGENVWNWTFGGAKKEPAQFFQEVAGAGVLLPGSNKFTFRSSVSESTVVRGSDVVVWFQVNI